MMVQASPLFQAPPPQHACQNQALPKVIDPVITKPERVMAVVHQKALLGENGTVHLANDLVHPFKDGGFSCDDVRAACAVAENKGKVEKVPDTSGFHQRYRVGVGNALDQQQKLNAAAAINRGLAGRSTQQQQPRAGEERLPASNFLLGDVCTVATQKGGAMQAGGAQPLSRVLTLPEQQNSMVQDLIKAAKAAEQYGARTVWCRTPLDATQQTVLAVKVPEGGGSVVETPPEGEVESEVETPPLVLPSLPAFDAAVFKAQEAALPFTGPGAALACNPPEPPGVAGAASVEHDETCLPPSKTAHRGAHGLSLD